MGRFESSRAFLWVVWGLRIVTGALFVMSGLVKVIDLWGFVFKIEEKKCRKRWRKNFLIMRWNFMQAANRYIII